MGFFSGLANITGLQAQNVIDNPEQASVGANTPESTYALNKTAGSTMDKHYKPTMDMYGGYTQDEMQRNAQQGYSNTGAQTTNAVGQGIASYLSYGASTMGQAALNQYEKTHPGSTFNQEYNGTVVAATPTINQGIYNNTNQGVYAKGGTVGLHNTAHYLKSKGRGKDTELVHMDKGELQALKGLAAKHGGNLTTNPHTGLPEAGFLSAILPAAIGIGTAIFAPELLPLVAGGVGLTDYAMTGSITKGLMAGLSAYGAGSMGGELAEMGGAGDVTAESEANAANWGSEDTVGKADLVSRGQGMMNGLSQAASAPGTFLANNAGSAMMATAPILTEAMNSNRPTVPVAASSGNTNPFGLKTLSPNFKGEFPAQPDPHYQAKYPNYQQSPYQSVGMAAGGSVPSYSGEYGSVVGINQATQGLEDLYGPRKAIATPTANVGIVQDANPNTRNKSATAAAAYNLNAAATRAGLRPSDLPIPKQAITLGKINPYSVMDKDEQSSSSSSNEEDYASGGVAGLGGYASGGNPRLLSGPGDGMSDSIPANIGGKQPARLADGEFVVPADVVSHLGNGSTDAGAKKLYSMMDKIRQARTGKKKQAPAVKADKYIPK
jgi:hypothetical protein